MGGLLELLLVAGPIAVTLIVGATVVQHAKIRLVVVSLVYLVALRLSIDQIIGPLVLGRVPALRPPVVIFALLVGGIFGPVSLLLATPATIASKIRVQGDGDCQKLARD